MKKLLAACTAALQALGLARGGNSAPRHAHKRVRITKPLAVFTTAILALGLGVVGVAASASAHTGDLDVTAVCNAQTGQYDLTATLTISQTGLNGSTKWKVGTSNFTGTPSSNQGLDRGPVSSTGAGKITLGTFSIPGTTTNKGPWVYAFTTWSDNFQKGSDGQLTTNLSGNCKTTTTVVTAAVTFTDAVCTGPGVSGPSGSYTIPTTTGVQYELKGNGQSYSDISAGTYVVNNGKSVTIRATAKSGYTITGDDGPWTHSFVSAGACLSSVIPADVSFTGAVCTGPGTQGQGSYTIPAKTGVVYKINGNTVSAGTVQVAPGTSVTITAVAATGYTLTGTTTWTHAFLSAGECAVSVTVTPASMVDNSCTTTATLTLPSITGVVWKVNGTTAPAGTYPMKAGGPNTVVASAATGYTLTAPYSASFTFAPEVTCVTPVTPTFGAASCDVSTGVVTNGYITIPATTGVSYFIDGVIATAGSNTVSDGPHTVTAVANANYKLLGDTASWPVTIVGAGECNAPIEIETDPYASSCTALADTEFTSWIHVSLNEGVVYKIDGTVVTAAYTAATPNVAHHVTAEAAPGFTLVRTHAHEWTLTPVDTGVDCTETLASLPSAASSTNQVCSAGVATGGSITVGQVAPGDNQFGNGVSYFIDGVKVTSVTTAVAPGTYHVTATVDDPQDTIDGDSAWTFTIAAPSAECPQLKTLAFTGADGNMGGMLIIALFLLLGGAGVYTASRLRSRES